MTKKQMKEMNKRNRVMIIMNTGTRVYKSAKDYDRRANRVDLRRLE